MADYIHYFPKAKNRGDYPSKYNYVLIQDHNHLDEVLNSAGPGITAVDTETTSLNHTEADVVGFSLCHDPSTGYYVPTGHDQGNISDIDLVYSKFSDYLNGRQVLFYNKRFDIRILESVGIPINFDHFDVQILTWLTDTNKKFPSLKWSEEHFLGWEAETFDELTESHVVNAISPEDVCQYAATDALGTYHLFTKLSRVMQRHKFALLLDNAALDVVKLIEETALHLDVPYIESLFPAVDARLAEMKNEIFQLAGRVFNPGSNVQVGEILLENGCAPEERTKTGKVATSAAVLSKIDHPLPKLLMQHNSLSTVRNSYIKKLVNEGKERKGKLHISHKTTEVPTGRMASGADKNNSFFAKVNIMSIPKPSPGFFRAVQDQGLESILGWKFDYVGGPDEGLVEGFSPDLNIRKGFIAPKGYTWVSIDYNAQELRLPANFSKEPVLVRPFVEGRDVHTEVAESVFGSPITKKERGISKVLSFGLMYGGTAWTIKNKLNCPIEEAEEFKSKYEKGHKVLYRWKKAVVRKSKRLGYCVTYYGRPRRLRYWYNSSNWRQVKFGERSAISSVVQGTASDLLKKSLVSIYTEERELLEQADFLFHPLVHDEINFLVRTEVLESVTKRMIDHMTVQESDWPVPMTVEASFGYSWGSIFPFKLVEGKFVPKVE